MEKMLTGPNCGGPQKTHAWNLRKINKNRIKIPTNEKPELKNKVCAAVWVSFQL